MSFTIAITGKGGTGKTTIAGLIIASLVAREKVPVLAVDADPNSCLDEVLGVTAGKSIGRVREESREAAGASQVGLSKKELLEMKINEGLAEGDGFDLITMGRPEGPGCYCYANSVLKDVIHEIADSYPYVIIDNEAGLENLSRRIVKKVDLLLLAADPSRRGIATLRRLYDLAAEMNIEYDKLAVAVNMLRDDSLPEGAVDTIEGLSPDFLLKIPDDGILARWAESGKNLRELPASNTVYGIIDAFVSKIIQG